MRVIDETHLNQMNTIKQGRNWVTWGGKNTHRQSRAVTYRPRDPGGTSGLPDHGGEEGAMVERLGRQAKAESWIQRLEAETGDPPAMMPMETGRPAVIPPHRWWAEGEQRGCQTTAGEEAGAGGWAFVSLRALRTALRNKIPPWAALGT